MPRENTTSAALYEELFGTPQQRNYVYHYYSTLRQCFVNGQPAIIDEDSFVPSALLRDDIAAARAEEANGDYDSVTAEGLDACLDNLMEADR